MKRAQNQRVPIDVAPATPRRARALNSEQHRPARQRHPVAPARRPRRRRRPPARPRRGALRPRRGEVTALAGVDAPGSGSFERSARPRRPQPGVRARARVRPPRGAGERRLRGAVTQRSKRHPRPRPAPLPPAATVVGVGIETGQGGSRFFEAAEQEQPTPVIRRAAARWRDRRALRALQQPRQRARASR